jgi:hypothetical protein
VRTTRFWTNLHQVRSKSKGWKANYFNVLEAIKTKNLNRIAKMGDGQETKEQTSIYITLHRKHKPLVRQTIQWQKEKRTTKYLHNITQKTQTAG